MNWDGVRGALNRIEPATLFLAPDPDRVICSYACINVNFRIHINVYSRVCVCVYLYVCVCVCVYVCFCIMS